MFWRFGWILDSLRYRVEKDIRETIYLNKAFQRNRWGLFQSLVIYCSKHFLLSSIFIFFLISLISFLLFKNYSDITSYLAIPIKEFESYLASDTLIFGSQVTMLGLVFPLVIAFIGILLQNKSSNEPLWLIYQQTSGFLLVGYSALSLIMFSTFFEIIKPIISDDLRVTTALSIHLWFLFNLVLSGWFFWKTIDFLTSNNRMKVLVRYVINEVIVPVIRAKLIGHYSIGAKTQGLLRDSVYGSFTVETYSIDKCTHRLITTHKEQKSISNIFYLLLNWAVFLWSWQKNQIRSHNDVPHIVLPLQVSRYKKDKTCLAETNHAPINILSKLLIHSSVMFSSKQKYEPVSIEAMFSAFFGQIEDSLSINNFRLFDASRDNLVEMHNEIQSSLYFIADNGNVDNWILLTDGEFFGRSYLHIFIPQTIKISKYVTQRIPDDINYFENWCYFYPSLYTKRSTELPTNVVKAYIDGHSYLWDELMSWMGGYQESEPLANQQRDRAIKKFVGSWEYWRHGIKNESDDLELRSLELAQIHLQNTSSMVVSAAKHKNWDAAEWAADTLIHWRTLFCSDSNYHSRFGWHYKLITPETLQLPLDHILNVGIFHANPYEQKEALSIALKNHWEDIRFITVAYLLALSQYKPTNDIKILTERIMSSQRLEPSGIDDLNPISSLPVILGIFLRQNYAEEDTPYLKKLVDQLERLASIEEPEWISGRVYSSYGNKSEYLLNLFKILGIGLSSASFRLSLDWEAFLKPGNISQTKLEDIISKLKSLTENLESLDDPIKHFFDIDEVTLLDRKTIFTASINMIIRTLNEELNHQINNADLDREKLDRLGEMASASTFNLRSGPIPISLFTKLTQTSEFAGKVFTLNINNFNKSRVSKDIEVKTVFNEAEWFDQIIQQHASITTFEDIHSSLNGKVKTYSDSIQLLTEALQDAENIKLNNLYPILFVGPFELGSLIENSRWGSLRESDRLPFEITIETEKPNSYICHLSGIEVHRFPYGSRNYSLLFARQSLDEIKIKKFDENRFVDVDFNTGEEGSITGTLSLSYGIECKFIPYNSYKYILLEEESNTYLAH